MGRSADHAPHRSLLSFSLCLMGRSADYLPGASAEGARILYYGSIRYGCGFGCAKARLGPKGRSETCPSGCLCLGSSCLAVCLYSGVSEFVLGKTLLQMPSVYL